MSVAFEDTALLPKNGEGHEHDHDHADHDGDGTDCGYAASGGGMVFKSFRNDDPAAMTLGRRLARYLSRYEWYDPHGPARREYERKEAMGEKMEGPPPPSLDDAWALFERVTLPRYMVGREGHEDYPRARVGELEHETRLYPVWATPEKELGDFGEGVGLYFITLRCLCVILLIAGLINIPTIRYFASDEYGSDEDIAYLLRGSAICATETWDPCPTCTLEQWDFVPRTNKRYAEATGDNGETLRFVLRNDCEVTFGDGMRSYTTLLFVFVSISILCYKVLADRKEKLDEAEQTTTDYSVQINNPPPDARDAEAWREYFSRFGHVTVVTVALDNEDLIKALVYRRSCVFALEELLPAGLRLTGDNLDECAEKARPPTLFERLYYYHSDGPTLRDAIRETDDKIRAMTSRRDSYDVCEIFVTFETEEAQRKALTEANSGEGLRFGDADQRLTMNEPPEPSAVRWHDLDRNWTMSVAIRLFTTLLTVVGIVVGCLLIALVHDKYGSAVSAFFISFLSTGAPYVCEYITALEPHHREGSVQASRYFKVTAFRWAFTALTTSVITPFADTVSNEAGSIINSLYAIFMFEMIRGPITKLVDYYGHFYRHVMGPRAVDQSRMNLLFQGGYYELSERYTNTTTVLFVTFYYGLIFPTGFFFASATLFIHYWTDKFCILRTWDRAPRLGTQVTMNAKAFIMLTIIAFAVVSSFYVASFPFDNACEDESAVPSEYVGTWTIRVGDGSTATAVVEEGDDTYHFCNQDMLRFKPPAFPAVPSNQPEGGEWMEPGQEKIASIYGWTSLFVLIGVLVIIFVRFLSLTLGHLFYPGYRPSGKVGQENFSDPDLEIRGYVPQVRLYGRPFPLLLCDTSDIEDKLIGWEDWYRGYRTHNVLYDLPGLSEKENLFSKVKQWLPPGMKAKPRHNFSMYPYDG